MKLFRIQRIGEKNYLLMPANNETEAREIADRDFGCETGVLLNPSLSTCEEIKFESN